MALTPPNSAGDDRVTITCIYCQQPQEVGRRAMTITCKFCSKSLRVEDLSFNEYRANKSIETTGVITVEKKGNIIVTDRMFCGGLVVRGRIKGNVISRGPVLISPEADIKGDVTAPTLAVGAGAVLEGQYAIGQSKDKPNPPNNPANGSSDSAGK